jgi:hypothetical protein
MIGTILLVFAFVLTLLAAFLPYPVAAPVTWRFPHLGWLGVSLWILSVLLGGGVLR